MKTAIHVKDYTLRARNGNPIRTATKVTLPDGQEIKFIERLTKSEAIKNVQRYL